MGKKKFKDGLESLFLSAKEDSSQKKDLLFEGGQEKAARKSRSSSGKHFSDELEIFFQETLQESIHDELYGGSSTPSPAPKTPRTPKPKDGLDSLIRRTIATSEMELHYDGTKKRVAFSFDKDMLEKLKHIARLEKTFFKDIISQVVAEYIREYEQKKGKLD